MPAAQTIQYRPKAEVRTERDQAETDQQNLTFMRLRVSELLGMPPRQYHPGTGYLTYEECTEAEALLKDGDKYGVRCMLREARERWYQARPNMVQVDCFGMLSQLTEQLQEA